MPEELIHLHSSGSLPGIPGHHSAGSYWVDWEARSIRPNIPQDTPAKPAKSDPEAQPEATLRKRKQAKEIEE